MAGKTISGTGTQWARITENHSDLHSRLPDAIGGFAQKTPDAVFGNRVAILSFDILGRGGHCFEGIGMAAKRTKASCFYTSSATFERLPILAATSMRRMPVEWSGIKVYPLNVQLHRSLTLDLISRP